VDSSSTGLNDSTFLLTSSAFVLNPLPPEFVNRGLLPKVIPPNSEVVLLSG